MSFSTTLNCGPTVSAMTEPPRPPGEDNPDDPTRPAYPPAGNEPPYGSVPPPPPPPPYGGYQQQPPGYGPPPGYVPPPGYGQQPYGGQPGNDDRTWVLVAHFGGAAGMLVGGGTLGWVAPLVALLARGQQSPYVRAEAVKALNFQLVLSIIAVVCWVLSCLVITWLIAIAAIIVGIIYGVIAGAKAANGEPFNYPFNFSLIK
jgi:uncharacterized Tic20 family protein